MLPNGPGLILGAVVVLGSVQPLRAAPIEPPARCVPPALHAIQAKGGSTGPDVVVGNLLDARLWGTSAGIAAYSIGTVACNVGDQAVSWLGQSNQHPVVSQALYRLRDDRLEQVGMSWLKHGFLAAAEDACGLGCQDPGTSSQLGIGCSDPYDSILNGHQRGMGPRSELDAATAAFTYPFPTIFEIGDVLYKRLQVKTVDIDPSLNAGARYFAEGHYLAADDALAGNDDNNASYREISFGGGLEPTLLGGTVPWKSAIEAWRDADPGVTIVDLDVPGDGRFKVAVKVVDRGNGTWRYEYALYNMSSHRSARSFAVPLAPGTQVAALGFHDVDYHSGEVYDGTDWSAEVSAADVRWQTASEAANANANALRFATTYNFWFDADRPPLPTPARIGLFRAGSPAAIKAMVPGPGDGSALLLGNGRFQLEVEFRLPLAAEQRGHAVQLTGDSGYFWFFDEANVELVLKVLDGCDVNGRFWVFAAGLTDVETTITVTDTHSETVETYVNPAGTPFAPLQDTSAFECQ